MRDDTTEITANDIPDWYVVDRISLAQYLNKNSARSVIRIFAREVILADDCFWQANLSKVPLDLRIDCDILTIIGRVTIDCSGANTAIGWKSWGGNGGGPGFDGGAIEINARTIRFDDETGRLNIFADGGAGGDGQNGQPGMPGQDAPPPEPGRFPMPGGSGDNGGAGGLAGIGGAAGCVSVSCTALPIGTSIQSMVICSSTGGLYGSPGSGGKGGPGGAGIRPGPNQPYSSPDGMRGYDGPAGPPRPEHQAPSNTPTLQVIDSHAFASRLANDPLPHGLEIRCHRFITAAVYASLNGSSKSLKEVVAWLNDLADPKCLNYPSVVRRIQMLIKDAAGKNIVPPRKPRAIQKSAAISLLQSLSKAGSPEFNKENPTKGQAFAAAIDRFTKQQAQLAALRGTGSMVVNPDIDFSQAFSQRMLSAAARLKTDAAVNDTDAISVDDFFKQLNGQYGAGGDGAEAESSFSFEDVLGDLTADALCASEMMLAPELGLAAAGAAIFSLVLSTFSMGLDGHNTAMEAEHQRAMQQWAGDMRRWKLEEATKRKEWDDKQKNNSEQASREIALINAQDAQAASRNTRHMATKDFGNRYIGVLDSLEPVENDPGFNIAVFDCLLYPEITDPVSLALYIVATYTGFSFFISIKLSDAQVEALQPGKWHRLQMAPTGTSNATIATYVNIANIGVGTTLSLVWELPGEQSSTMQVPVIDTIVGSLLSLLLQTFDIPVKKPQPLPSRLGAPANYAVDQIVVEDVGQGACHTFYKGSSIRFVHDIGRGTPSSDADMLSLGDGIAAAKATICMSHWDRDHYRMGLVAGSLLAPSTAYLGPAYGINGPTLKRFVESILSGGKSRNEISIYLGGPFVAAFLAQSPYAWIAPDFHDVINEPNLKVIPNNVVLGVSTKLAASYDKNNTLSISAVIQGAAGRKLLLPGDCSFSYIPEDLRKDITHLEATHHGSAWSLKKASGTGHGTVLDNDIPAAKGNIPRTILLSNGSGNSYGHSWDLVKSYYLPKKWSSVFQTSTLRTKISVMIDLAPTQIESMSDHNDTIALPEILIDETMLTTDKL